MVNRGWIRVVEAAIAVLLVTGVVLFVMSQGYVTINDLSQEAYEFQQPLLREIQLNEGFRTAILSVPDSKLPLAWSQFDSNGLSELKLKIETRTPSYLVCESRICRLEEICTLENFISKDVYALPIAITATSDSYQPRQLKMFCWARA